MASTNINIRTDSETKAQAQAIFAQLGLDMSTAINIFLKQAIREGAIPFALRLDVPRKTWSDDFLTAFSKFGQTPDATLVAPAEIPQKYNAPREEFE
jgi:addiction module RelB/DinJ family antitoxin